MDFLPLAGDGNLYEQLDFILVSGDAYVDHPSFANALVARYIASLGYKIGIIAQPDFNDGKSITPFGEPKYAFLVSSGNIDSMVNHFTANKKQRCADEYSPGGAKLRPKRATLTYCNLIRQNYEQTPIIIGGIEASLRRFAHYDYWDDTVRRSILEDSGADLLIYGMGERPLGEVCEALASGLPIEQITYVRGTCYLGSSFENIHEDSIICPSFEDVFTDRRKYASAFKIQYSEQDWKKGRVVIQPHGAKYLVQNPPSEPLSTPELDYVYALPFNKLPHPRYKKPIAAASEVMFSLTSARGCFGGCSFCAISSHQGRYISARSTAGLIEEATALTAHPDFKGYIHDVGGPTANFMHNPCEKAEEVGICTNRRCLYPKPCRSLDGSHSKYMEVLRAIRKIPGVKKVFVRSGVRFDYALLDEKFIDELAHYHVSGQLKIAPEHCAAGALSAMGKPGYDEYKKFCDKFSAASKRYKLKQFTLPYFICSHPGTTLKDAVELAKKLKESGFAPDCVQDFYPTPGTVSTCMYYTGIDPLTMKKIFVPKTETERKMQRALINPNKPENYKTVKAALIKAGRTDLIGNKPGCLIR